MAAQPSRLPSGGLIDRGRPVAFRFNGRALHGYAGDTLASALLANGVRVVARSFKYHRPRGIFAAGAEEPNALVRLADGARAEPNLRATRIPLFPGLSASSQNCWPSVAVDAGAVAGWFARLLPAGFYYKTFMSPSRAWPQYERWIRRAAGMGRAPTEADPDCYAHVHAHCDVLVVGGGPAGLAAALAAGRRGARVILAHQGDRLGGGLLRGAAPVDGRPALEWVQSAHRELTAMPEVRVICRATAAGYYDDNLLTIAEVRGDGDALAGAPTRPRQRYWKVRARQVVLATGAIERPLLFADNDRPGVMLAAAARLYLNRFAVQPGRRAVVVTNNDSAHATALELHRAGVQVAALVDERPESETPASVALREAGVPVLGGHVPVRTRGRRRVSGLEMAPVTRTTGPARRVSCDAVLVSGGWTPSVHLFSQSQGRLRFDEMLHAHVPDAPAQATRCAGALNGRFAAEAARHEGENAGRAAAEAAGFGGGDEAPCESAPGVDSAVAALVGPSSPASAVGKQFVDLQNDVTAGDVALAVREGYRCVEHVKRYTTLGMGTDQGKTSNLLGLGVLARCLQRPATALGVTTFRPLYTPITLGAIAGQRRGRLFQPYRRTPFDRCHDQAGAVFVDVGAWRRAACYPRPGESRDQAAGHEAAAVRRQGGFVDISTLGRIEVQGPDAAAFLDRIYINAMTSLAVGRCRYAVMLREDGLIFDDGTVARLGDQHFHVTTTTGHAAAVMEHLEYLLQACWPWYRVFLTAVTDAWAGVALAGPAAREVLARLQPECDIAGEAFGFMRCRETRLAGDMPARLFRMSYSGELAFEITVPADCGAALWQQLTEAGASLGVAPYGTEAMGVLRIEKGHCVTGAEIDGRTSPYDLGLGGLIRREGDFVGRRSLAREALHEPGRKRLVGLVGEDDGSVPIGAQLTADADEHFPKPILGHVTSACYSPALGKHVALALLAGGDEQHGQTLSALSPLHGVTRSVRVQAPVFVDAEGARMRQ